MFEKEKIHLGIHKTLLLEQSDRFWMVLSGVVDVFYVDINDDFMSMEGMVASLNDIEFFASFDWI